MCKKPPKRRKVGDTIRVLIHDEDGNEVNPADVNAKIQWYANGVAIVGETDAEYDVLDTDSGVVLSVIVTIDDEEYTDYTAKVQGEDKSEDVSIIDLMGLQSDGTGIIGDTLRISYGASFGTVTAASWYKDGAVVATMGSGNSGIDFDLDIDDELGTGTYKATVFSDGKLYETNEIVITNKEEQAEILDFTIEDDYTDGKAINYGTYDNNAIVTVTLNKNYNGKFELFKANDSKYNNSLSNFVTDTDKATVAASYYVKAAAGGKDNGGPGAHKSVLTTDAVKNFQIVNLKTAATEQGLGHINSDGSVTYKFVAAENKLTRGSDYIITFDQNTVLTDKPGQGNENVFGDAATVPYVESPAKIAVTKVANANAPEVTFYNKNGEVLTWFGEKENKLSASGIAKGDVYYATEKTTDTAKAKALGSDITAAGHVKKGVWTSNETAGLDAYWFAQFETTKGIFAKESVKFTSEAVQIAKDAADMINLREKGTDTVDNAKTATVEFSNLRADGTVYIVRGRVAGTGYAATASASDIYKLYTDGISEQIVGSAAVTAGTSSIDIPNVIGEFKNDATNKYIAVFVPDDAANYGSIYTKSGLKNTWKLDTVDGDEASKKDSQGLTVKQKATTLDWDKDTKGTAVVAVPSDATITLTGATLKAKDQFGEAMITAEAVSDPALMTPVDNILANTEKGTFTYETLDGTTKLLKVVMTVSDAKIDPKDGFKFTLLGKEVTVTMNKNVATENIVAETPAVGKSLQFDIKIGGDAIVEYDAAGAAENAAIVEATAALAELKTANETYNETKNAANLADLKDKKEAADTKVANVPAASRESLPDYGEIATAQGYLNAVATAKTEAENAIRDAETLYALLPNEGVQESYEGKCTTADGKIVTYTSLGGTDSGLTGYGDYNGNNTTYEAAKAAIDGKNDALAAGLTLANENPSDNEGLKAQIVAAVNMPDYTVTVTLPGSPNLATGQQNSVDIKITDGKYTRTWTGVTCTNGTFT